MPEQGSLLEVEESYPLGIDYGRGQTNIDINTGIRYGFIPMHEVEEYFAWVAVPKYKSKNPEERHRPDHWKYRKRGYWIESRDYFDLWVFKSPYYTFCQYCNPHAPGAGYILRPVINGAKTYCLGHEWFIDEKAPYRMWSVKTGKEITPVKIGGRILFDRTDLDANAPKFTWNKHCQDMAEI